MMLFCRYVFLTFGFNIFTSYSSSNEVTFPFYSFQF